MKKSWVYLFFSLCLSFKAFAFFESCRTFFPNSTVPITDQTGRDLCFDSFAVFYSPATKKPIYVVEKLNRDRLLKAHEKRTNHFYEEARLRANERSTLRDYAGSGYDRGHNAPAGDMADENSMAQSFSLANMMPQAPENNRGVWAKLVEKSTRQYVLNRAQGDVFVFTGSVGEGGTIGLSRVVVPTHLFKLVFDQQRGRAWAYWVENTNDAHLEQPISYEELKQKTQIDFLLNPKTQ